MTGLLRHPSETVERPKNDSYTHTLAEREREESDNEKRRREGGRKQEKKVRGRKNDNERVWARLRQTDRQTGSYHCCCRRGAVSRSDAARGDHCEVGAVAGQTLGLSASGWQPGGVEGW